MIKAQGEERTEGVVRGWMANQPRIFESDSKLLEAIAAGQCDVGIANTYSLAHLVAKDPTCLVAVFWPEQDDRGVHINIPGAGVTKYAKHCEQAITRLEFLSSTETQNLYADVNDEYPANPAVKASTISTAWAPSRRTRWMWRPLERCRPPSSSWTASATSNSPHQRPSGLRGGREPFEGDRSRHHPALHIRQVCQRTHLRRYRRTWWRV
jgi:hypothetical protein